VGEWFERSFGSDYMVVYKHRDWDDAVREVRCMMDLLQLPEGVEVLDVGCGMGRHALALADMGYKVTGIDLSDTLLRHAARQDREGRVEWVLGDMRNLPLRSGSYAATVNFFTSFGYFETEEENAEVLRELRRVLRDDGRFLIDYLNPVLVENQLVPHSERVDEETGWLIEETRSIEDGAVVKHIRIQEQDGTQRSYTERVRLYPLEWFAEHLGRAGLRMEAAFGDYSGSRYDRDRSERLIVIGAVISP
jgi:ubiquinone/menaquinone biosynthesis C-methylase UbiE